jgi:glycosyltransferase involved in cell wall biosynthesis
VTLHRLAIDGVGAKHSGAAVVLQELVTAALRNPRIERLVVFTSPRSMCNFDLSGDGRLQQIEIARAERGPLSRLRWLLTGLPAAVGAHEAGALICLGGGGFAPSKVPCLLFIQQSLPFSTEAQERLSWPERVRMRGLAWTMQASARRAALVIVQTATMKRSVMERFQLESSRIAVVEPCASAFPPNTAEAPALKEMRATPPGLRLLYVGNTSAYKNLGALPAAMRRVRATFPGATLFCTVPAGHAIVDGELIRSVGYLDRAALREAYLLATALVMPSLVETVGLPMLEAASLGVPVVAADRPYARDVCGESALFFDPLDSGSLSQALEAVLRDPSLRASLASRGRAQSDRLRTAQPYDRIVVLAADLAGKALAQ